jgi:hypothetical protein
MQDAPDRLGARKWLRWAGLILLLTLLLLAGCSSPKQPAYQDKQGFRFTPPSGWVERAREDAMPSRAAHKQPNVPLPPLGVPGKSQERLLVEYYRLTAGRPAWLQVTVADAPAPTFLKDCLSAKAPGPNWKREAEVEGLEVSGLPAGRIAFAGRWSDQDYLCETVALLKAEKLYLITASFPAADAVAREQVRKAVDSAGWQ